MFDLQRGIWSPDEGVIAEFVAVPSADDSPTHLVLSSSAIAVVMHADGSSNMYGGANSPSLTPLLPDDLIVLLPPGEFHVSLVVSKLAGHGGPQQSLECDLSLRVTEPSVFARMMTSGDTELSSFDFGYVLAHDSSVRLAARKALLAGPQDLQTRLQRELSEALDITFGLGLVGDISHVRVSEGSGDHPTFDSGVVVGEHWRLVKRLGQGSFGEVWLVEHTSQAGLYRALKVVREARAARSAVREAKRVLQVEQADIDFRHVARLMDVLPGDPPCLLYEYVVGKNLRDYIDEMPSTPAEIECIQVIEQVLLGVEQIHRAGLVHRDLHPGNVMVAHDESGLRVKLLDLGLAVPTSAASSGQSTHHSTLSLEPSHPFAEPNWMRDGSPPDQKTDIYAAGMILWWILTGQVGVPTGRAPNEVWPEASEGVLAIVQRATAVPRDERLTSVQEMLETLQSRGEFNSSTAGAEDPTIVVSPDGSGTHLSLENAVEDAPPGATVRLVRGSHKVKGWLEVKKPLSIIGDHMDQTEVLVDGTIVYTGVGVFAASRISFRAQRDSYDRNVFIVENGEVHLQDCRLTGASGSKGAGLVFRGNTSGVVTRCRIEGNSQYGIRTEEFSHPEIIGNVICRTKCGISHVSAAKVRIVKNTVVDNEQGILLFGDLAAVESNDIKHNDGTGIECQGANEVELRNNSVSQNRLGIFIHGRTRAALEHNSCDQNVVAGIAIGRTNDDRSCAPHVFHNLSNFNGGSGILFLAGAGGEASFNTCRENEVNGIQVEDSASPLLEENECTANEAFGIAVSGHEATPTIRRNVCRENKKGSISGSSRAKRIVEGNDFETDFDSSDTIVQSELNSGSRAQSSTMAVRTSNHMEVWSRPDKRATDPSALVVHSDGSAYVCNPKGGCVLRYDRNGRVRRKFTPGRSAREIHGVRIDTPIYVAVAPNGAIFVAGDGYTFRIVHKRRLLGTAEAEIAGVAAPMVIDSSGVLRVVENDSIQTWKPRDFGHSFESIDDFAIPLDHSFDNHCVAIDTLGSFYVCEPSEYHDTVMKISPYGEVLASWGEIGSEPGQFKFPSDVAVDSQGCICIADTGNHRVQRLTQEGEVTDIWTGDSTIGRFVSPKGVAVDSADNVYVSDTGNRRIVKISRTNRT